MSDQDKDGLSNQETDDLLASLNERASSKSDGAPQQEGVEEEEGGEDIEAFLAGLEGDEEPATSDKEAKEEPDPFADAFAELEDMHGDEVDAEFEARMAALEAEADKELEAKAKAKPPEKKPEPRPPTPEDKAPAKESAPVDEEEEEPVAEDKADKKSKKKKKKKEGELAVVQSQQSKKVTFAFGAVKWTLLLTPVFLSWWVLGAFLGQWLETGWLIAIAATVGAFILPLVLWLAIRRGKWAYYACALGVIAVAGLIAPWPGTAGKRLAHYGHWPVSTVAQLAGWQPDHAAVTMSAWMAEVVGHQVEKLAPSQAPAATAEDGKESKESTEALARALGTEEELRAFAEAKRTEARKNEAKEKDTKKETDDEKVSKEEKDESADKEKAEKKEEKSEESAKE